MKSILLASLVSLALGATAAADTLVVDATLIAGKTNLIALKTTQLQNQAKKVLADVKGMSVYTFDSDSTNTSTCSGGCIKVWPPLEVPAGATVLPPYSSITGNNGKPQLTLNGLPLYYFHNDKVPADAQGEYGPWHLVVTR